MAFQVLTVPLSVLYYLVKHEETTQTSKCFTALAMSTLSSLKHKHADQSIVWYLKVMRLMEQVLLL